MEKPILRTTEGQVFKLDKRDRKDLLVKLLESFEPDPMHEDAIDKTQK